MTTVYSGTVCACSYTITTFDDDAGRRTWLDVDGEPVHRLCQDFWHGPIYGICPLSVPWPVWDRYLDVANNIYQWASNVGMPWPCWQRRTSGW